MCDFPSVHALRLRSLKLGRISRYSNIIEYIICNYGPNNVSKEAYFVLLKKGVFKITVRMEITV